MKKVLIAGGAGFIGSHLSHHLLESGFKVTVIDNLITGNQKNIAEFNNNLNFEYINADISEDLEFQNTKFDIILHFASPASPPRYFERPHETIKANIDGTRNLVKLAKEHSARLVYASTSEIYGDPKISPQDENYWGNVNPIGVRSIYDESKRMGETLVSHANREGLNTGIIRIFNTFGPKMDPFDGRVVSTFIRQALTNQPFTIQGSGKQTRSFCYISDLVEGITKFMHLSDFGPINLGNPNEISILALAEIVSELLGVPNTIMFKPALENDPMQRKPNIERAKELLDWFPKISLQEGINLTASWMKNQL